MSGFQAVNPSLLFSRRDPQDPRLGEIVQAVSPVHTLDELSHVLPSRSAFVIGGYPDDEGIQINGGRKGAKDGPDAIRKFLYKMTPELASQAQPTLLDIGNLVMNAPLAQRHETGREFAHHTLKAGHRWFALGGGHDFAYSDTTAFASAFTKPLIINFDAHLDVRPTDRGLSSGTGFYRLLEAFPEIDLIAIGIQKQCNSTAHLQWLKSKKGRVIFLEDLLSAKNAILPILDVAGDLLTLQRPTFLSVDMDVFDSSYAPGCSQSWPIGLQPGPFMHLLTELLRRLDVRGVGIYEVSPPLDVDDHTAKLAALILHQIIYHA
jgi:formiminoglutamase